MRTSTLSKAIRHALLLGCVLAPVMSALAESATTAPTPTGTRVKRGDGESVQPLLVIRRSDLEKSGLSSLGDVLQRLPVAGASINTQFNSGGDGSTTIDLRNLGAQRTLVLLNGRRWVPGLGGAVDLNTIPTAIIESVEVLKDGASAVYGSDAIAGVINVITRSDFDGATMSGFYGENSEGDGTRYSADFTIGASSDRGNVTLSAGFVKEEPIRAGDREISAIPNFGLDPLATGSSTTPFGRYGLTANGRGFDANGRPVAGGTFRATNSGAQPGATNSLGQFRAYNDASDAYNFAPENYLVTPQERASIFATGRYDLADWVQFNAHMMFNQRQSKQELAAMPVGLGLAGSGLGATIQPTATNPYNPWGQTVTLIQRRFNEAGPRVFAQDVDTFRFGGGFTGAFELGDRYFDWEAGMSFSENDQNDSTRGLFNLARIRNALTAFDADPGAGFDPRCGTPGPNAANPLQGASLIAGCVPLNIFGGPGSITRPMINYITFTAKDKINTQTRNYFANLSGVVAELPAGDLGIAVGYEYRNERGFDDPDAIIAAGETTGNSRNPTNGSYALDEFYGEAQIPILRDAAFAEILELRVAGRYSDYTNFGDTTNFSSGFQWKPIADLKIRGNYNEGFRAPTILELFRGQAGGVSVLQDPCSLESRPFQAPQTVRNCLNPFPGSPGTVPAAYQQSGRPFTTLSGGEAGLAPESSRGHQLGLDYRPAAWPDLSLSLDWWKIEIDDIIGNGRSPSALLLACYRDQDLSACERVRRDPVTGEPIAFRATAENLGSGEIEGVDVGAAYRLPEFDVGQFDLRLDATYFIKEEFQNLAYNPTAPYSYHLNNPVLSSVGLYSGRATSTHRLKANFTVDWALGDWSASWKMRFVSRMVEACPAIYVQLSDICTQESLRTAPFQRVAGGPFADQALPRNDIGGVTYYDLSVAYSTPLDSVVRVGINNAFDKEPPLATSASVNSYDPSYDVPGRFWYLQYTQRF